MDVVEEDAETETTEAGIAALLVATACGDIFE
jgi:hypothetical protein